MKFVRWFAFKKLILLFFLFQMMLSVKMYGQISGPENERVYKVGLPNVKGLMYVNDKGKPEGFPFEIVMHLFQDENLKFEWVEGSWSELYEMLCDGEIDLLPGTQVTTERRRKLDYLNSSLFTMWSELYLADDSKLEGLPDLVGKKIALVENDNNASGFVNYIKDFNIAYEPVIYKSHEEAVLALKHGQVYAMVGPTSRVLNDLFSGLKNANLYFNPTDLNLAFPKNKDLELQRILNHRIELYKKDPNSIYHQLIQKYGLANFSYETHVFPPWSKYILISGILILLIAFFFIYMLRKQVDARTLELRKQEDFLKRVLEIGEMGGWSLELATNQIYWSDELYHLHGLDPEIPITTKQMEDLIHPDDRMQALNEIRNSIKNKENFTLDFRVLHSSGEYLYTKQMGVLDLNEKDSKAKIIGITKNATKEKSYELELVDAKNRAEANDQLKTLFINNMSHEIRTPMNAIMGFTSMLNKTGVSEEKRKTYTHIVKNNAERLLRIIDDILEISVLGTKQACITRNEVCLNHVFDEIYSRYKTVVKDPDVSFVLNKTSLDQDCTFISDESILRKIIGNILENAIKYTKSGIIELGYFVENHEVQVTIKDTGLGIPKENLEQIFERFYQLNKSTSANYGGLGLGLSIAKENADLVGGELTVTSELNQGTTFVLTLPFEPIEIIQKQKLDLFEKESLEIKDHIHILIAEDEDVNFLYLETLLNEFTECSFQILWAKNGEEAIRFSHENHDLKLILMDLKMPVLDGYGAARQIKEAFPQIPIVAQTAYSTNEDKERALLAGCDDFITKPISEDTLKSILKRYL